MAYLVINHLVLHGHFQFRYQNTVFMSGQRADVNGAPEGIFCSGFVASLPTR